MENGTLWIEKSESFHEGHYLCKADNGVVHGSSLSKLAEISVNGKYHFKETSNSFVTSVSLDSRFNK